VFPKVDLHIYERSMFSHRFYVTDCDGAPANLTGHSARLEIRREFDASGTAVTVAASSSSGLLLTYAGSDLATGTPVQFTTAGTLPTGLSAATTYYLVRVSATTARVATTLANAFAGTVITYTNAGSGAHTMTPQAFVSTSADDLTVNAAGYVDLTWTGLQTEAIGSAHGPALKYDLFIFPTGVPANAIIIAHGYVVAKKNVAIPA
jgi:hypothetical protein